MVRLIKIVSSKIQIREISGENYYRIRILLLVFVIDFSGFLRTPRETYRYAQVEG